MSQSRYEQYMEIRFKRKYLDLIADGIKSTTIRRGRRKIFSKYMRIFGGNSLFAEAEVRKISYKRVYQLSLNDAIKDGFLSIDELLEELKEIYPSLSSSDWITIIEFKILNLFCRNISVEVKYKDLSSKDIALLALKYDLVRGRGAEILRLVIEKGGIWQATVSTGRASSRFLIRKVVLDALHKLKENNII